MGRTLYVTILDLCGTCNFFEIPEPFTYKDNIEWFGRIYARDTEFSHVATQSEQNWTHNMLDLIHENTHGRDARHIPGGTYNFTPIWTHIVPVLHQSHRHRSFRLWRNETNCWRNNCLFINHPLIFCWSTHLCTPCLFILKQQRHMENDESIALARSHVWISHTAAQKEPNIFAINHSLYFYLFSVHVRYFRLKTNAHTYVRSTVCF